MATKRRISCASLRVECVSLIGGHFKATLVVRIVDPDPYVSGDSKKIQRTPREKYGKGCLGSSVDLGTVVDYLFGPVA
jgi:hypothetical protein